MFDRLNIPKKNLILIKEDTILEKIGVKSNKARELNRGFFGQWEKNSFFFIQSVQMVDVSGSS